VIAKRYSVKTLGCKANLYDSQLLEAELQKRGWTPALSGETPDLCVVNSCTVTDEADRQSRKLAQKAAAADSKTRVVLTGCGAEVEPEKFAETAGVDFVVGNQNKNRLVDLVLRRIEDETAAPADLAPATKGVVLGGVRAYSEILSRHPIDREWNLSESAFMLPPVHLRGESGRVRGFLKIQDGCNAFCTYCIIPYGRGPSRSPSITSIVEQVRALHSQGIREVILTGTNIGDFGIDWAPADGGDGKPKLEELVSAILEKTEIERVRIGSLDPTEITPELRSILVANPRACAHFHVSLQSAHSKVLRLMKRKYAYEQVEACLTAIAALPAPNGGAFVGMDVITGFPGEGEEEFELSLERLRKLPWSRLHVFPYSEREGTPATRLPNAVYPHERARRAKILRELSLERMKSVHHGILEGYRRHGRTLDRVLIEGPIKGPDASRLYVGGYSSNYVRTLLAVESEEAARALSNQVVSVAPETLVVDSSQGDVAILGSLL
jgi:threonylcarbamoyladenosine tRNA methylthiotransferase MtaB